MQVTQLDQQRAGLIRVAFAAIVEVRQVIQLAFVEQGEQGDLALGDDRAAAMEGQVGADQRRIEARRQPQRGVAVEKGQAQAIGCLLYTSRCV